MAKKKSKASNSARGYATTSIPSRSASSPASKNQVKGEKNNKTQKVEPKNAFKVENQSNDIGVDTVDAFDHLLLDKTLPTIDAETEVIKNTSLSNSKSFLHSWQTDIRLRKNDNVLGLTEDEIQQILKTFRDSWKSSLKESYAFSNRSSFSLRKRYLWTTFLSLKGMGFEESEIFGAFSSIPIVSIDEYITWMITENLINSEPSNSSFSYEVQPSNYTTFCRMLDEPLPANNLVQSNSRLVPLMKDFSNDIKHTPNKETQPSNQVDDSLKSKDSKPLTMSEVLTQLPEDDIPFDDPFDLTSQYVKVKLKMLRLQIANKKNSEEFSTLNLQLESITSQYLFSSKEAEIVFRKSRIEFMNKLKALQQKLENERIVEEIKKNGIQQDSQSTDDSSKDDDNNSESNDMSPHNDAETRADDDAYLMGDLFNQEEEDIQDTEKDLLNANYTLLPLTTDKSGTRPSTTLQYELHKIGSNIKAEFKTMPIGKIGYQSTCFVRCSTGQKTFSDPKTVLPTATLAADYISMIVLFRLMANFTKISLQTFSKSFKEVYEKFSAEKQNTDLAEDAKISEKLDSIIKSKELETPTSATTSKLMAPMDNIGKFSGFERPPETLLNKWRQQLESESAEKFKVFRNQLPATMFRETIIDAVNNSQLLIISGDTGCGKSTQIPAFLLENSIKNGKAVKIYVTEPRRISAISLANRVSQELGGNPPSARSHELVGYSVRLDSKCTPLTPLTYVTTGTFLRLLEVGNEIESVTHLIIDEVHERSIDSDLLLIHVLHLLKQHPHLKIIIMSATLNAEKFQLYFEGSNLITIPGKTYPVHRFYLEDILSQFGNDKSFGNAAGQDVIEEDDYETDQQDASISNKSAEDAIVEMNPIPAWYNEKAINYGLIVYLLKYIFTEGDPKFSKCVLVFLPGISEILRVKSLIEDTPMFRNHRKFCIYMLHSTLSSAQQQSVFNIPPKGCRKIVLSTNIAETGVTIPDVTCVIDTGVHREMRYNSRRHLSRLTDTFVSKANAKQRSGRAGRVQEGICYHLFSKFKHDTQFLSYQTPEILRLNLQEVVLRVKMCQMGDVQDVLGKALDPPSSTNIIRALEKLHQVGALSENEKLTKLGKFLSQLPVDANLGKILVLGCFYKCVDAASSIVAMLTIGSPFRKSVDNEFSANKARLSFAKENTRSDLVLMYYAYCAWREICLSPLGPDEDSFAKEKYLNLEALSMTESLKIQLLSELKDMKLLGASDVDTCKSLKRSICRRFAVIPKEHDINSGNAEILCGVIAASLYPNILRYDYEKRQWSTLSTNKRVRILDVSVNNRSELPNMPSKFVAYTNMMSSTRASEYVNETTMVTLRQLLMMCGLKVENRVSVGQAKLDNFTVYFENVYVSASLSILRRFIETSLNEFFAEPDKRLLNSHLEVIVNIVSRLNYGTKFQKRLKD